VISAYAAGGNTQHQAPHALINRFVGILHGCLRQNII
jgi:hypothetical protein